MYIVWSIIHDVDILCNTRTKHGDVKKATLFYLHDIKIRSLSSFPKYAFVNIYFKV